MKFSFHRFLQKKMNQKRARVYLMGPQYEAETPVNIINNISINLSTEK